MLRKACLYKGHLLSADIQSRISGKESNLICVVLFQPLRKRGKEKIWRKGSLFCGGGNHTLIEKKWSRTGSLEEEEVGNNGIFTDLK